VYSYNSIFHLSKADSGIAIDEMFRVLKKGGLLFVNFLSVEDSLYKSGEEVNPGEFLQQEGDNKVIHSFYQDIEPDTYFKDFEIIAKEKMKFLLRKSEYLPCFLNYIVKKG
jgi:ubiquinone/menaquinone biosynthesis C-methylase UbiE